MHPSEHDDIPITRAPLMPRSVYLLSSKSSRAKELVQWIVLDGLTNFAVATLIYFCLVAIRTDSKKVDDLLRNPVEYSQIVLATIVTLLVYGTARILRHLALIQHHIDTQQPASDMYNDFVHIVASPYAEKVASVMRAIIRANNHDESIIRRWLQVRAKVLDQVKYDVDHSGKIDLSGTEVMEFVTGQYADARASVYATWITGVKADRFFKKNQFIKRYWQLNNEAMTRRAYPLEIERVFVFMGPPAKEEMDFILGHLNSPRPNMKIRVVTLGELDNPEGVNFADSVHNDFAIFDNKYVSTWPYSSNPMSANESGAVDHATWYIDPQSHGYATVMKMRALLQRDPDCVLVTSPAEFYAWYNKHFPLPGTGVDHAGGSSAI